MLIDSHCHLDFPELAADRAGVLARAKANGVERMVTISTRVRRFDEIRAIAEANAEVWCSVGTHPHNAHEEPEVTTTELVKLAGIYGPQEVPFEDLLEASNLPKKRQLIEKREARQQEAAQGSQPQQQMAQVAFQTDIEAKQAKIALDVAKTEQIQTETVTDAFTAGYQTGEQRQQANG